MMFCILIGLNTLISYETFLAKKVLFEEGGFIESIGAFAFLFSGILLLFLSFYEVRLERRLTLFFAVTCIILFLREVDVEDLNAPYLVKFLGAGEGRDALFVSIYLILTALILWKDRPGLLGKARRCFKSQVAIFVLIGCVALLVGSVFEKCHQVFAEELMEMNGALFILFASLLHIKHPIYIGQDTPDPHVDFPKN